MFVRGKYGSPPREWKMIGGPSVRQTMLDNYFVIKKSSNENVETQKNTFKKIRDSRRSDEAEDPAQMRITDFF